MAAWRSSCDLAKLHKILLTWNFYFLYKAFLANSEHELHFNDVV